MTTEQTTAEAEIDEALIRELLREQHPDLAGLAVRPVPGGWDNQMWRLGDELALRMPRTPRAPGLLAREERWLPVLAPGLPLPVPVPLRAGEPSPMFGRPWAVVQWVHGDPADAAPVTAAGSAEVLAGFLSALHEPAPDDAPDHPGRGVALAGQRAEFDEWLSYALDGQPLAGQVRDAWEKAVAAPVWTGPRTWLHGDLHPANVVTRDGELTGIVDFGELCAGDPATDLSAAWLLLPDGAATRFFAAYRGPDGTPADAATVERARGWALLRGLSLVGIGHNGVLGLPGGKPTWEPAGYQALNRALQLR
jgi:aminoglycoside phosphotransferase (APT) family kinase protein